MLQWSSPAHYGEAVPVAVGGTGRALPAERWPVPAMAGIQGP